MGRKAVFLSALPMAVYGAVYAWEVVAVKLWDDFYGFVQNGNWAGAYVLLLAAVLLLGFIHAWLHDRFDARQRRQGEESGRTF